MNSYFEQSGFYGQTATGGAEQAYRFPLGLAGMGVSPYTQHTQPRPPTQDGYDSGSAAAAVAASGVVAAAAANGGNTAPSPKASGLYSPINDTNSGVYKSSSNNSGSGGGGVTPGATDCKDQNGYSSLSKELNSVSGWNSGGGTGGAGGTGNGTANATGNGVGGTTPVRPSVCTPEMTRYTPTAAVDAVASARDRWMNTCSGLSSASAVAAAASQPQLQQATSPHQTFYPWMAIAGKTNRVWQSECCFLGVVNHVMLTGERYITVVEAKIATKGAMSITDCYQHSCKDNDFIICKKTIQLQKSVSTVGKT